MILREGAEPVQRRDHRDVGVLGEREQLERRARLNDTVAGDDERMLRVGEHRGGGADRFHARGDGRVVAREVEWRIPFGFDRCLLGVLGDVHQHRPRPPGTRDVKRFGDYARERARVGDQVVVFRDRCRDAGDVHLLEGVGADERARHLSGDGNERRAVHPRIGDGRHEVRGARSAGGHADPHAPAGARVPLGGMSSPLFVPAEHVAKPVAILPERVIERHDGAARDAEDQVDTLADERLAEDLCSGARRRAGHAPTAARAACAARSVRAGSASSTAPRAAFVTKRT